MTKNRMLPFGYKVERGAIMPNDAEAEAVRRVFRAYAAGSSYKAIAEALTTDGISYTPDKPIWNKNMIARLLQNESYLGTGKYPAIVEAHEYNAAKTAQKQLNYTEPPALRKIGKLLVCGECGMPLARRIHANGKTRWYCKGDNKHIPSTINDEYLLKVLTDLFRILQDNPRMMHPNTQQISESALKLARLQNDINELLEGENLDEPAIRELILRLATAKYDACDDGIATAVTLQDRLKECQRESELDTETLMAITDHIEISSSVKISLTLKSGQTISEGA